MAWLVQGVVHFLCLRAVLGRGRTGKRVAGALAKAARLRRLRPGLWGVGSRASGAKAGPGRAWPMAVAAAAAVGWGGSVRAGGHGHLGSCGQRHLSAGRRVAQVRRGRTAKASAVAAGCGIGGGHGSARPRQCAPVGQLSVYAGKGAPALPGSSARADRKTCLGRGKGARVGRGRAHPELVGARGRGTRGSPGVVGGVRLTRGTPGAGGEV